MRRYVLPALVVAVAAVAAAASPALADESCRHGQRVMQLLDLNGDGSITQSEAAALQEVKFLRWD